MVCSYISLKNYRNIEEAHVSFDPSVNILIGDNAQGKTNLLEAVYTFALGKSFRGAKEADIIKFGEREAMLEIGFKNNRRENEQTLRIYLRRGARRRLEHNGVKIDRISEMIGNLRAVLFCPEHLSLIKEGPSLRRNYLDVAISQFRPVYLRSLQRYYAVLEQRNKLIRGAEENRKNLDDTVFLWSEQLAEEAALISDFRYRYVKKAEEAVKGYFEEMTGGEEEIEMRYIGSSKQEGEEYLIRDITRERYKELLSSNIEREIYAGSTLYGIHKDDIEILINGKSSRLFASQGQQRSLALAMKLAEGDICFEETGERSVLLLDDVLSELDGKRRNYLLSCIKDRQVIISSCERLDLQGVKKIYAEKGKYFSEEE